MLATFLPGRLTVDGGTRADYQALARFHYLPNAPATYAAVWVARYEDRDGARAAGVAVLSHPTPRMRGREQYFGLRGRRYGELIDFANANVRTISRVIVHPQFRSLGLASELVRVCCANCPTRFTEAAATMARAHPFFEKAGMRRVDVAGAREDAPWYFVHDKGEGG